MKKNINISYNICILIALTILSRFECENLLYPSILTLLSRKLVLVSNNGIHFFDSNLDNEETNKYIPINIELDTDNYKTAMEQFSEEYGGYILILVRNIIYFFDSNGNNIYSENLSEYLNGNYYCLIPYKKEGNYLYYIISYISATSYELILHHFIFELDSHSNQHQKLNFEVKVIEGTNAPTQIIGVTCLFMINLANNKILTCFYGVSYPF